LPADKGGKGEKGREGERMGKKLRGKEGKRTSERPYSSKFGTRPLVETLCCQVHLELLGQYRQMIDDKLCSSSSAYSWHNMDV